MAIRTLLISNAGSAALWTGEFTSAEQDLEEAARLDTFRTVALPTLNALAHSAYLCWLKGELDEADSRGREAVDRFARMGIPQAIQAKSAYLALAGVAVDRDELKTAKRWLAIAEKSQGEPHTAFAADLMSARLCAARNQFVEAVAILRQTRTRFETAPLPPSLVAQSWVVESEVLSAAGNHQGARAALEAAELPLAQVLPADCRRARLERKLAAARSALAAGATEQALDEMEEALVLAGPMRLRQPFLARGAVSKTLLSQRIELGTQEPDFAADLLGRFAHSPAHALRSATILIPLTARELNILRYLATAMSLKEIAQSLYVSVNTVKTHQRAIHQKLGANDRRTAIAQARSIGLL